MLDKRVAAGIHCNPGAAYTDVGVSEKEVETLAGDKEGCGDEIDFIEVQRPVVGSVVDSGIISDSDIMPLMKACHSSTCSICLFLYCQPSIRFFFCFVNIPWYICTSSAGAGIRAHRPSLQPGSRKRRQDTSLQPCHAGKHKAGASRRGCNEMGEEAPRQRAV
jgi:hypothetical protein